MEEGTERSTKELFERLKQFAKEPENQVCADCCCSGEPMKRIWISTNLGVFLCINCAGVHRSLGTHLSAILSLELDDWNDPNVIEHVLHIGNKMANACWLSSNGSLHRIPISETRASPQHMRDYILAKYTGKEYKPSDLSGTPPQHRCSGASRVSRGILRIQLVCGFGIAKQSQSEGSKMQPSPFVVFKIGAQQFKSKTQKKNANPVWKEKWMANIPENTNFVGVECWNNEGFLSKNESLGSTRVDLDCIKGGEEHFMVLKLTKGELHCIFQFTEL
eukprot:TRINITY_DN3053_c0_g1_i1.p1 TRINITY_DN3053_c0_g1~~TRINITY_DN3053_c0_g1_i1.p1  ORF type:complete len:276 (-),score=36.84 TRINITY_DN3053_c0_g1_i1:24-851(-)